jgi:hypothetical protein
MRIYEQANSHIDQVSKLNYCTDKSDFICSVSFMSYTCKAESDQRRDAANNAKGTGRMRAGRDVQFVKCGIDGSYRSVCAVL